MLLAWGIWFTLAHMLLKLLIRIVAFGVALAFVSRQWSGITIEPRSRLPWVAATFALLNVGLYLLLKTLLNAATLWMLWFAIPLVVNAILLWATSRISKSLRIEGVTALFTASAVLTAVHWALRWINL